MNARTRSAAISLALGLLATAPLSLRTPPSLAAQEGAGNAPSSRAVLRQMSEALKAARRMYFVAGDTYYQAFYSGSSAVDKVVPKP
jgi:hypothetical protein